MPERDHGDRAVLLRSVGGAHWLRVGRALDLRHDSSGNRSARGNLAGTRRRRVGTTRNPAEIEALRLPSAAGGRNWTIDPLSLIVPARQTFIRLTEGPGRQPWVLILLPAAAVYAGPAAVATFAAAPISATTRRSDLLGSRWPSTTCFRRATTRSANHPRRRRPAALGRCPSSRARKSAGATRTKAAFADAIASTDPTPSPVRLETRRVHRLADGRRRIGGPPRGELRPPMGWWRIPGVRVGGLGRSRISAGPRRHHERQCSPGGARPQPNQWAPLEGSPIQDWSPRARDLQRPPCPQNEAVLTRSPVSCDQGRSDWHSLERPRWIPLQGIQSALAPRIHPPCRLQRLTDMVGRGRCHNPFEVARDRLRGARLAPESRPISDNLARPRHASDWRHSEHRSCAHRRS